jgi:hypothetical protein
MLETLGRNMAVELDSRHPLLPYSISLSWMEPVGSFMGICIDLSKKKRKVTKLNIMQK